MLDQKALTELTQDIMSNGYDEKTSYYAAGSVTHQALTRTEN
jgi:hypothetical protein